MQDDHRKDGLDKAYAGIVADIALLARKLAENDQYKSSNGSDALLSFAQHLEGIVAAVGVNQSKFAAVAVSTKRSRHRN